MGALPHCVLLYPLKQKPLQGVFRRIRFLGAGMKSTANLRKCPPPSQFRNTPSGNGNPDRKWWENPDVFSIKIGRFSPDSAAKRERIQARPPEATATREVDPKE